MYITSRVHVCNRQSYVHSLWRARQLFVHICGVAGGQTKVVARAQKTIRKMNIRNNLGDIDMCMYGVFLHANRVGTVHTAYSGFFNFLQGANTTDVILGIKKQDRQESRSLMVENGNVCVTYVCLRATLGFLVLLYHGLRLWSHARNSISNGRQNERAVTTYNTHLYIWYTIELGIGVWFGFNIYHLYTTHIFLYYLHRSNSEQQMIEYSWSLQWRVFSTSTTYLHVLCINKFGIHVWCCCSVYICVHQHTWVCRHQHRTGARRRQIRLERIRYT